MTNMNQTSIDSYHRLENVNRKQLRILTTIQTYQGVCNYDLAEYLDLPINQVTGRVSELREAGLIKLAYKEKHPVTNRTVCYWGINEN